MLSSATSSPAPAAANEEEETDALAERIARLEHLVAELRALLAAQRQRDG